VIEALDLFNRSLYAFANHHQHDRYVYDFEMLGAIEAMAQPYQKRERAGATGERARIAVLVFGALHVGSVILKILATFAEHVDRTRFELAFFVPEAKRTVSQSKSAREQLEALERPGWSVYVPRSNDALAVLLDTANAIHEWAPDVLLTSALCADLRHYFIASTRPAAKTVGLVQGPPPQFTAPWLDWNIAVSAHPGLDTPGNCNVVPLEFTLPSADRVTVERREQFGLPPASKVIISAGRPNKFESSEYWHAIADILSHHPDLLYMAIGIDCLPQMALGHLCGGLKDRVRLVNWRTDYLGVLAFADIVLDTYPSGGGVVLLDAMALGIPVVSMANDYLHEFDQTDWGLGNEFVCIPELIAPRHDFACQVEIVSRLLADETYRARLGRECETLVRAQRGSPARMIGRWEEVFSGVVARPKIDAHANSWPPGTSSRAGRLGQLLRKMVRSYRTRR
jgi:glycosyltransferase involved in cell wall biosynthesis